MSGLKICLWLAAIACILSLVGVFLPMTTLQSLAEAFGAEQLPDSPLCVYMVRTVSTTYVLIGVFFVILALNPAKYGVLVPFAGIASVLLGVACLITGLVVAMPVLWFLGDSLSCLVLGVLIVVFWRKASRCSQPGSVP